MSQRSPYWKEPLATTGVHCLWSLQADLVQARSPTVRPRTFMIPHPAAVALVRIWPVVWLPTIIRFAATAGVDCLWPLQTDLI
jgi:hypothetical protein